MAHFDEDLGSRVVPLLSQDSPDDWRGSPSGRRTFSSLSKKSTKGFALFSRRSASQITFRVSLAKSWHGVRKNGRPGSIILIEFFFENPTASRRIKSAAIDITFEAKPGISPLVRDPEPGDTFKEEDYPKRGPPEVVALAPEGYVSVARTAREIKVETGVSVGGVSVGGLAASASGGVSKATEWAREGGEASVDSSTISGTLRSRINPYSADSARWVLTENASQQSGIPNYMRTAILIERDDDDADFILTAEVSATVSGGRFGESHERLCGSLSTSNAVIFRPSIEKGPRGQMDIHVDPQDLDASWNEVVKSTVAAGLHLDEPPA